MVTQHSTTDGTCDESGCEEVTPVDMPAIILGDEWFCSPDCARESLAEMDAAPDTVALHDPQFAAPREKFPPAVSPDAVDIRRPVTDVADARDAIDELEDVFPAEFRVEPA